MTPALRNFLVFISPLIRCSVFGTSMVPTLNAGDVVLVNKLAYVFSCPETGDIIVVKRDKLLVKRVEKKKENFYYLTGDNKNESTDSRHFGWVEKKHIVGKVILKISKH